MPKTLLSVLTLGTLIIIGGLFYVIKYGYKPESVKIMDFTHFGRSKNIGVAVFRRFWAEMQTARIVIVGEDGELKDRAVIWDGFIEEAARKGLVFDVILNRPSFDEIEAQLKTAQRMLVRIDSNDTNVAEILKRNWAQGLYFHESQFVPRAGDDIESRHICDSDKDVKFECQIQKISKQYRRKKADFSKYIAIMERTFANQYVLFVYEPETEPSASAALQETQ